MSLKSVSFGGDPLAHIGRNIIQDHHDDLKRQMSKSLPDVPDFIGVGDYHLRRHLPEDKVGILGAGVGGLYTALILDSLDIKYEILEASDRTGGRLFTYKFPESQKYDYYDVGAMRYPLPKKDEQGRYKNGVMKRLGELTEYSKLNQGAPDEQLKSQLIPYYYKTREGSSQGFMYFNGTRVRIPTPPEPVPDFKADEMGVLPEYVRAGVDNIVNDVVQPFAKMIASDIINGGTKGWDVMKANDAYSTRAYMSFKYIPSITLDLPPSHLSTNTINWCEMLDKSSGWYDRGLTETVLEALAFAKAGGADFSDVDWKCFDGGSQVLTNYMENYIKGAEGAKNGAILFGKRVTAINAVPVVLFQNRLSLPRKEINRMIDEGVTPADVEALKAKGITHEDVKRIIAVGTPEEVERSILSNDYRAIEHKIASIPSVGHRTNPSAAIGVTAEHEVTLEDLEELIEHFRVLFQIKVSVSIAGESNPKLYEHVISTLPLPCLRTIDMSGAQLNVMQKTSLRQLQYGPSIKVGMRFTEPWWTTKLGIVGGQSFTDLPIRTVVYPSYGVDSNTPPTVLIVSYCWTNDAERTGSLIGTNSNERLEELMLRNLAMVHGGDITYQFLKGQLLEMHAWDWNHNPLTMGAFAFFGPGDFQDGYKSLNAPAADNRLHFAGEAISTRHAWVVGALDSAWRAVYEYLILSGQSDKLPKFKELWGENLEWTRSGKPPATRIDADGEHYSKSDWSDLILGHIGFVGKAIEAGVVMM